MIKEVNMKNGTILLMTVACFIACSCSDYKSAENVATLSISFIDPIWDGKTIPASGQCRNCGGGGLSPSLSIKNIPKDADFIIAEFKDKSMGVFHGAIRFQISQKSEFVIPSIPEQTLRLPQNVEIESEHRAPLGERGAYMAPCGCGTENMYEATVLAIKKEASGQKILLGKGTVSLGKF